MTATPEGQTSAFLFFQVAGGIVGLPLVFLSIVASRQLSKHPTLLNFCATWFFSSVIYMLLFFAGKQRDQYPPYGLCVAQASMVNGALPMTSAAGVGLVAHIWHSLGPSRPWSTFGLATYRLKSARLVALLAFPYLIFLTFTIAAAIVGHTSPERVTSQTAKFYCTVDIEVFNVLTPTITIIFMASILLFEVFVCLKIFTNSIIRAGIEQTGIWLFWLRMTGFSIYAIMTLIVATLLLSDNRSSAPYITQASLPFVVFLFIASQKEVLHIWKGMLVPDIVDSAGQGHHRFRSTTSLLGEDQRRSSISSFGEPDPVQMKNVNFEAPRTTFIAQSAIPPSANIPHRPKRPTHTGLSGLDAFFGKPIRPAKERSRSRTKTRTPVQLHKNLPQTPIPPVPQLPPLPLSREPEPIRPYEVAFPDESTLPRSMPGPNSQGSAVQAVTGGNDFAKVIATQKQTISRLLDEASYINRTLDRMKTVEDSLHKTQNQLVTERRTATQLRNHANRLEADIQTQKSAINNLATANKELEIKYKLQEEELGRFKQENQSLSDALQHSVRNEMQWQGSCEKMKLENESLLSEAKSLKEERDVLLDIWSTLESPIDWEIQKGRSGLSRMSPQYAYPELAKKMRQRASTPGRPSSRATNRQTRAQLDVTPSIPSLSTSSSRNRSKPTSVGGVLDRLRPRMLEISGKNELSEKVSGLEDLVREQAALIEQLEATLNGEVVEKMLHEIEGSLGSWSVPRSISSSMVAEGDVTSR